MSGWTGVKDVQEAEVRELVLMGHEGGQNDEALLDDDNQDERRTHCLEGSAGCSALAYEGWCFLQGSAVQRRRRRRLRRSSWIRGLRLLSFAAHLVRASVAVLTRYTLQEESSALCLDGSTYAYGFREGRGSGRYKWVIHLQGGSWCATEKECLDRRGTSLGTRIGWEGSMEPAGPMSEDSDINPLMYNWNVVFMPTCDGSSFLSDRAGPLLVNETSLYMRGHAIFRDTILHLLHYQRLTDARVVVLTGCSSGALGALLNLDRLDGMLGWNAPGCLVVGLVDAGWFLDSPEQILRWRGALKLWNGTQWLPEACLREQEKRGNDNIHRCFFPRHVMPTLKSPIFVLQPVYDGWMFGHCSQEGEHSAYMFHRCFRSLRSCYNTTQQVGEELGDFDREDCLEVEVDDEEMLRRGDEELHSAAKVKMETSRQTFQRGGKISLKLCQQQYRLLMENSLSLIPLQSEERSEYFSQVSDEHCVTSYDVVDWLHRGGWEFEEWMRKTMRRAGG
uniref:Pectin acetylesterase n=1 Tax=Guillardia theta TaxID=55529 RepID=A0A7S4KBS0_GUITH|mmetsp:Transcript_22599/g.74041  ORF Transcript_22599/g.74041 Transcript_22599/m.74041 type:complete len:505 (+) Transcript_22599:118-1632(+)